MFTVELYAGMRRAVMVDGLSRREAAKRFGVHRNTISKMLQFSIPPGYRRRERPASKKLGPYMAWIDKVLEDDKSVHLCGLIASNGPIGRSGNNGQTTMVAKARMKASFNSAFVITSRTKCKSRSNNPSQKRPICLVAPD